MGPANVDRHSSKRPSERSHERPRDSDQRFGSRDRNRSRRPASDFRAVLPESLRNRRTDSRYWPGPLIGQKHFGSYAWILDGGEHSREGKHLHAAPAQRQSCNVKRGPVRVVIRAVFSRGAATECSPGRKPGVGVVLAHQPRRGERDFRPYGAEILSKENPGLAPGATLSRRSAAGYRSPKQIGPIPCP